MPYVVVVRESLDGWNLNKLKYMRILKWLFVGKIYSEKFNLEKSIPGRPAKLKKISSV